MPNSADWRELRPARAVTELQNAGFSRGTVVDLGCGSGILAEHLSRDGYNVIGVDISESMITIARQRAPQAQFFVESFTAAEIPPCVAVTAIGEIFNYAFDAH